MTGQGDHLHLSDIPSFNSLELPRPPFLPFNPLDLGAAFPHCHGGGITSRCRRKTVADGSVRNASNRVFRAVQIFLCFIMISTGRVFFRSASDYQCDEQDFFDLANDSIVASSASLQPLEAKLQRSPETPQFIGCLNDRNCSRGSQFAFGDRFSLDPLRRGQPDQPAKSTPFLISECVQRRTGVASLSLITSISSTISL